MRVHRNLGIVLFIAGIASLAIGGYINKQVADGRVDLTSTHTEIDGYRTKSRTGQVTPPVDGPVQPTIGVATNMVIRADSTARLFEVMGAILMLAGISLIIYSYYENKRDLHNYRDPMDPRDPRV